MKIEITKTITETVEFTIADALRLITNAQWRGFSKTDYYGYAGVMGTPRIADVEWNGIRGDVVQDDQGFEFHFNDNDEDNLSFLTHTFQIAVDKMDYQLT